MTSSPSKPTYKWWETDDKTKRLYTELIAEKLSKSSPRKGGTLLTRSLSDINFKRCSDQSKSGNITSNSALRDAGTTSKVAFPGSPGKQSLPQPTPSSSGPTPSTGSPAKKYTFETITMDTLAKYDYIKSPKKVPTRHSSSSLSSMSSLSLPSSPSPSFSSSEDDSDKREGLDSAQSSPRSFQSPRKSTSGKNDNPGSSGTGLSIKENGKWKWNLLAAAKAEDKKETSNATPSFKSSISSGSPLKRSPLTESLKKTSGKTPLSSIGKTTSFDTSHWMKPNPTYMLMTSSQTPQLKTLGGGISTVKGSAKKSDEKLKDFEKEKLSASLPKHEEVPEYKSSASGESSTDDSSGDDVSFKVKSMERLFQRSKNKQEVSDEKDFGNKVSKEQVNEGKDGSLDISEINKKFQSLCEEVEQLEFKMYEFSDDIHKLKMVMGMKETSEATNIEHDRVSLMSPEGRPRYKHSFTFAVGKDLLADRQTAHALLMRKHASPCKSPRAVTKLLLDTSISKEVTEAEARRDKELEAKIKKINETEMTPDEIQGLMKSAKAKYIDNPNYLEDMGIEMKNSRTKG